MSGLGDTKDILKLIDCLLIVFVIGKEGELDKWRRGMDMIVSKEVEVVVYRRLSSFNLEATT